MRVVATWLERPPYCPVEAPLRGAPGQRNRGTLLAVVAQFHVETTRRYQPTKTATWCNIFSWDVTSALGCEVPHWIEPKTGKPARMGRGAQELNANMTLVWLVNRGPEHGWRETVRHEAQVQAELGFPTLAIWRNPLPLASGHVAVVVPTVHPSVMHVAQAGSRCFTSAPLEDGFGRNTAPIRFFTHD